MQKEKLNVALLDGVDPKAAQILKGKGVNVIVGSSFGDDLEAFKKFVKDRKIVAILMRGGTSMMTKEWMEYLRGIGVVLIVRCGAGVDKINLEAASANGIIVENTPGMNANGVAELVPAFMVGLARNLDKAIMAMYAHRLLTPLAEAKAIVDRHAGVFVGPAAEDGARLASIITDLVGQMTILDQLKKSAFKGKELDGKTVGIIGLGRIGSRVARKFLGMGMHVLAYDPKSEEDIDGVELVQLNRLLCESDFISVHVSGNGQVIGPNEIEQMVRKPYLLNLAREGVVDLEAVFQALTEGRLSGFASDVDKPDHPVFMLNYTIVTKHVGATTPESTERCAEAGAKRVLDWLQRAIIRDTVNFMDASHDMGEFGLVVVFHENRHGLVKGIGDFFDALGINLSPADFQGKGDYACAVLGPDQIVTTDMLARLAEIKGVIRVVPFGE